MKKILIIFLLLNGVCAPAFSQNDEDVSLINGLYDSEIDAYEKKINNLKRFSKLRNERRDLLTKIPKAKSELSKVEASVAGVKTELEETRSRTDLDQSKNQERLDKHERDLKEHEKRLENLKKEGPKENQEEYESQIREYSEIVFWLNDRIDLIKQSQHEQKNLQQKRLELTDKLKELNIKLSDKRRKHERMQDELEIVEDKINTLLIPTTAQNEFKLWVTFAFTSLVGLVILGFFVVSSIDSHVRRAIFSSQSGIQFITLFSLVIAIILFGITDILGGKELAALLGGISGYILGRVSENRSADTRANVSSTSGDG